MAGHRIHMIGGIVLANDGQKKSMVQKALDTVERVGNRLPDPAVIFLILT